MIISTGKAQEQGNSEDKPLKRLKTPFLKAQARNKEKIIIITLQGTILNGNQEIPNISAFLNILKKETGFRIIYLGGIEAKQMKEIKKLFCAYGFPKGRILLKHRKMDEDQHFSSNLEKLREEYDIQVIITSHEKAMLYSRLLKIPIVKIPENQEMDIGKRHEIMAKCGCILH